VVRCCSLCLPLMCTWRDWEGWPGLFSYSIEFGIWNSCYSDKMIQDWFFHTSVTEVVILNTLLFPSYLGNWPPRLNAIPTTTFLTSTFISTQPTYSKILRCHVPSQQLYLLSLILDQCRIFAIQTLNWSSLPEWHTLFHPRHLPLSPDLSQDAKTSEFQLSKYGIC
jgi:hypothetical protein